MEELTDEVLLSKIGTHDFISNISITDLKSLDDGNWVTDNVISLVFKNIQRNVDGCNVTFVDPSITQMLRKPTDSDQVGDTMKKLKLTEKDYVFFPFNYNKLDGKGGEATGVF